MTAREWVVLLVPILVSAAGGYWAYRKTKEIADRNAQVESRKVDLSTYESLNEAIGRELGRVNAQLVSVTATCEKHTADMRALYYWSKAVMAVLDRPEVVAALGSVHATIPAPPIISEV